MKLTVAWNRFAFLKQSMTMFTSSLLSWASMPSKARSMLNQKLISCEAVPEDTSRESFVTAWMDLIHVFMCLKGIEKRRVVESLRWDKGYIRTGVLCVSLLYCSLDDGVDD